MNHALIIKATNRIAFYATIALLLWVIVFLTVTVFDLKIFRVRITETFSLSIFGIFAILGGSLVLNVMSNLSQISESVSNKESVTIQTTSPSKWKLVLAALSVPVIVGLLFGGEALSTYKKKELLISSAKVLVSENQKELEKLAKYEFSHQYIEQAGIIISMLEKIDKNFPEMKLIVPDTIDGKNVFLGFRSSGHISTDQPEEKQDYIFSSTKEDRSYLESAFSGGKTDMRFTATSGDYELYLPVNVGEKIVLLYFSDYERYGKTGP